MKIDWGDPENREKIFKALADSFNLLEEEGGLSWESLFAFFESWDIKYWIRSSDQEVYEIWYEFGDRVCVAAPYVDMEDRPDCLFLTKELAEKILVLGYLPSSEKPKVKGVS